MTSWSSQLREDLCRRAATVAVSRGLATYQSLGKAGVTLFPSSEGQSTHGNFFQPSFEAIAANPAWSQRLLKAHSRREDSLPPPYNETALELDSCTSSDALLMNVFCYPGIVSGEVASLLDVPAGAVPAFGVKARVPKADGPDRTEVDMQIGSTNVEAKLTESDFTAEPVVDVEKYTGLYDVFWKDALPRHGEKYTGYQLIRNVLAIARRPEARLKVLLDGRRPDLLREWWGVYGAISDWDVRARCGFVLWQELAAASPTPLRVFLTAKYGL